MDFLLLDVCHCRTLLFTPGPVFLRRIHQTGIFREILKDIDLPQFTLMVMLGLGVAIVFGTVISYGYKFDHFCSPDNSLINWSLTKIPPLIVAAYGPIELIFVVILAAVFLHAEITLRQGRKNAFATISYF